MEPKKQIIIDCNLSENFDIYINENKVDHLAKENNKCQYSYYCFPGKYILKVKEKHPLNSNSWIIYPIVSMIGMLLTGYGEMDLKGPYVAIEEGELDITDDSILRIRLSIAEVIYKSNFFELTNSKFSIIAKSNCSYKYIKKELVAEPKIRRRYIVSMLSPITIAFVFGITLFVSIGKNLVDRGNLFSGIFLELLGGFLIIMYIIIAKNILKVAFGKK